MAQRPKEREGLAGRALRFFTARAPEAAGPWLPKDGVYPALSAVNAASLARQSGVYACWHLGVRPRWVRVGGHVDLAAAITQLQQQREVTGLDLHGGVYVAWALVPREALGNVTAFLADELKPLLQGLTMAGETAPAATGVAFPLPSGTQMPSSLA